MNVADKFDRAEAGRVRQLEVRSALLIHRNLIGAKTLIETGTYHGATVEMMIRAFDRIMSVDISKKCLDVANTRVERQDRFGRIKGREPAVVELVLGNSIEALPKFLDSLTGPCVFWLDAHVSGDLTSPDIESTIMQELDIILNHPSSIPPNGKKEDLAHSILIDDARTMGTMGWPSISEIVSEVRSIKENIRIQVKYDIVQISPIINK